MLVSDPLKRKGGKMITVNELPDSPPSFAMLHCAACGNDYSANRGDYFLLGPDEEIKCECEAQLFITTRRTVYDHDKGRQWLVTEEVESCK